MEQQNLEGWGAARLLGSRGRKLARPWAVDRFDGDRWIEIGRYASEPDAEERVARAVAEGAVDASTVRIVRRPVDAQPPRAFGWVLAVGLVACGVLAVVLVLTRS